MSGLARAAGTRAKTSRERDDDDSGKQPAKKQKPNNRDSKKCQASSRGGPRQPKIKHRRQPAAARGSPR